MFHYLDLQVDYNHHDRLVPLVWGLGLNQEKWHSFIHLGKKGLLNRGWRSQS